MASNITQYKHEWYLKNKQKHLARNKKYREQNKESINKQRLEYRQSERYLRLKSEYDKNYRSTNKETIAAYKKQWYQKNKHKINEANKARRRIDPAFKILCNLRIRISSALKRGWKSGSTIKMLGCSVQDLKQHLESKFQPGLSWDNYGIKGWHIDHIKPLTAFNLSDEKQFAEAVHYTNLQPLWAKDNIAKGGVRHD